MTCSEIQERLDALLDGELAGPEVSQVERHLSSCAGCASERDLAARLREAMPLAYPGDLPVPAALDGLGGRVRAQADPPRATLRSRVLPWRALAAAALLLVLALPALWRSERAPQAPEGETASPAGEERTSAPPGPEGREEALALNREAERLVREGRRGEAAAAYERLAREHPDSVLAPRAEFALAALAAESDADRGVENYLAFAGRRPGHELADDALVEAAAVELARDRLPHAIALLENVRQNHEDGDRAPEAAWLLGTALERTGDREGALEAYAHAASKYALTGWGERARARAAELER